MEPGKYIVVKPIYFTDGVKKHLDRKYYDIGQVIEVIATNAMHFNIKNSGISWSISKHKKQLVKLP